MLEKLYNAVFSNDVYLDDVYSDIVTFFSDDMDHNPIDLNDINLDYVAFDEDDPTSIVLVRRMAWYNGFNPNLEGRGGGNFIPPVGFPLIAQKR